MRKNVLILLAVLAVLLLAGGGYYALSNIKSEQVTPVQDNPQEQTPGNGQVFEKPLNTTGLPLVLPAGFSVSTFAENLPGARAMTFDPAGRLVVSLTSEGRIVALSDGNGDGVSEVPVTVASNLNRPHGMVFKCDAAQRSCQLYVGETNQVSVFDYNQATAKATNRKKIADLPVGGNHFTRTLFDNGDKLLVSVGSSCNVCNESDSRRAAILEMGWDGSGLQVYASGLRNSVFLARSYIDGKIWATDMGRDQLGNNLPPEELNVIERGKNYGWPICYGNNVHDTNFDKNQYFRDPCADKVPAKVEMPAHVAPLGLAFVPEEGWPEEYWHDLLVAFHGSWNSSQPVGYKIARVKLDDRGNYQGMEDFMTGFLPSGASNGPKEALGRPVDILVQPGGVIYVSDDKAGAVYRVTYKPSTPSPISSVSGMVRVTSVKENSVISSPFMVRGEARGPWYFEATFPVKLIDASGETVAEGYAQADGEWMTENFVPFTARMEFKTPASGNGWLVLEKSNPSGLPEHAGELHFPVRF